MHSTLPMQTLLRVSTSIFLVSRSGISSKYEAARWTMATMACTHCRELTKLSKITHWESFRTLAIREKRIHPLEGRFVCQGYSSIMNILALSWNACYLLRLSFTLRQEYNLLIKSLPSPCLVTQLNDSDHQSFGSYNIGGVVRFTLKPQQLLNSCIKSPFL